jgi:YggT family protein
VIVYALLSWIPMPSVLGGVVARLAEPILRPIRRYLPLVGGIDLSPLVMLLILQVAVIVLGSLQASALGAG